MQNEKKTRFLNCDEDGYRLKRSSEKGRQFDQSSRYADLADLNKTSMKIAKSTFTLRTEM